MEKSLKACIVSLVLVLAILATGCGLGPITDSVLSQEEVKCGNGSAPDYGFTHDTEQPHWTRGFEGYMSQETIDEVDRILDDLYYDNIVETVVLVLPEDQVGNRMSCAVHYLRYMGMGRMEGPRKDNGFSFLFVVESDGSIDVHYGVGLGLPMLTAPHLSELNRLGASTYDETGSYDRALLAVVEGLDEYTRSKLDPISDEEYEALLDPEPEPVSKSTEPNVVVEGESSKSSGITGILACLKCLFWFGLVIFVVLLVFVIIRALTQSNSLPRETTYRSRTTYTPTPIRPSTNSDRRTSTSRPSTSRPSSSSYRKPSTSSYTRPSTSRPSSSSNRRPSTSRTRSGRGSGRSGRGN